MHDAHVVEPNSLQRHLVNYHSDGRVTSTVLIATPFLQIAKKQNIFFRIQRLIPPCRPRRVSSTPPDPCPSAHSRARSRTSAHPPTARAMAGQIFHDTFVVQTIDYDKESGTKEKKFDHGTVAFPPFFSQCAVAQPICG